MLRYCSILKSSKHLVFRSQFPSTLFILISIYIWILFIRGFQFNVSHRTSCTKETWPPSRIFWTLGFLGLSSLNCIHPQSSESADYNESESPKHNPQTALHLLILSLFLNTHHLHFLRVDLLTVLTSWKLFVWHNCSNFVHVFKFDLFMSFTYFPKGSYMWFIHPSIPGTPWTGYQSIIGPHINRQTHTLICDSFIFKFDSYMWVIYFHKWLLHMIPLVSHLLLIRDLFMLTSDSMWFVWFYIWF